MPNGKRARGNIAAPPESNAERTPKNGAAGGVDRVTTRAAKPVTKRTRTPHLPHLEREAALRTLLTDLKKAKTPCWPAEFCKLAKISKRTLKNFPEVAALVNAYGWESMPRKMRRHTAVPTVNRTAVVASPRARAAEQALATTVPALRRALTAARREIRACQARQETLCDDVATRSRIIEELISRLVTPRNGVAESVEDVLAVVRGVLGHTAEPSKPPSA